MLATEPGRAAVPLCHLPRRGLLPQPQQLRSSANWARLSRITQVLLGVIWLADGALQCQPYMFARTFITGVILPNTQGQPGVIAAPITWIAHLIAPHVTLFNGFAVALEVGIGLGLLYRRTVIPALCASFAWVLGIWLTGEGLGGLFTGAASPLTGAPGAALLYLVIGLIAWPKGSLPRQGRRGEQFGLLGLRGTRMVFAALWGGFALLWLLPANAANGAIHHTLLSVPTGAGWLTALIRATAGASAGHGTAIALTLCGLSGLIAVAAACDWHLRAFLWVSVLLSAAFWVLGQGFGGVLTGRATDLNSGPLLILLAGILLAARAPSRVIG